MSIMGELNFSLDFKATTKKEEEEVEEEKQSEEDEDLAFITRKFNKLKKGERFRGRSEANRRKKKAMMITWSESEESFKEENEKEVANMCFMAIDELDEGSKKDKWFLDSGCSRHMTRDESKFAFLTKKMEDMLPLETMQKEESLVRQYW
ncbi:hypothetical protein CK203_059145 [Vitis vinifera]|uniref:Uncharacterized protein n=1 Tax=Vitis vinifera TaxID=29760 RepID=A0A438GM31_VITVI|nr:hypothetical protein CK203_059145 [Vitis vinifera]